MIEFHILRLAVIGGVKKVRAAFCRSARTPKQTWVWETPRWVAAGHIRPHACTELDANELALAQQVDISDAATAPHHVRRSVNVAMKNCDACALDYMLPSRAADVDLTKDEGAGKGYQRPTQPRQSAKKLRAKARVPTSTDDDEGNNTDGNQDAHDEADFNDTVSDSASKKTKRAPPKSTDQNSSPTPEQLQIAELRGMLAQATATAAASHHPPQSGC